MFPIPIRGWTIAVRVYQIDVNPTDSREIDAALVAWFREARDIRLCGAGNTPTSMQSLIEANSDDWHLCATEPLRSRLGIGDGSATVEFKFNHARVVVSKVRYEPGAAVKK